MSGCLDEPAIGPTVMEPCDDSGLDLPDEVLATSGPGRISLTHFNATHNCCGLVELHLEVEGSLLTITETEVFDEDHPGCWCMCELTLSAEITGLAGGDYTVRVVDSLSREPYVDDIEVHVDSPESTFLATGGPGRIDLSHLSAEHNCCTTVEMVMGMDGSTITIREEESGDPCFCTCLNDIEASVLALDAGEYDVELISDGATSIVEDVIVGERISRIVVEAVEDSLTVLHESANWNCCGAVTMLVTLDVEESLILVEELETYPDGEPCRCTCDYDLAVTTTGFPEGLYTVRVFTREGGGERVFGEVPVHIPGIAGPDDHIEEVVAEATEDHELRVSHLAAPYNCCSHIALRATYEGDVIEVTEEIVNDELCYCVCEFDLDLELRGLFPGEYTVNVTAADGREVGSTEVTVTGDGSPPMPEEYVYVETGGGMIEVRHEPVELNCCAEIEMALEVDGTTLILEEVLTNPDELCDCMCTFNLHTLIDGLDDEVEYTVQLWDDGRSTLISEQLITPG